MTLPVPPLLPTRPWLSLYGNFLKPQAIPPSAQQQQQQQSEVQVDPVEVELAPIQELLPDEMLQHVLARLSPYMLGHIACVCRHWRSIAECPQLWQLACDEAFQQQYPDEAERACCALREYRGSWKRMFLELPHLRFDGIFVSRNSYIRTGVPAMSRQRIVSLVLYYRYYRFFPDGTLLYRTSPQPVAKVSKSLRRHQEPASRSSALGDHVFSGRYILKGTRLYIVVVYPNSRSTQIRSRLLLRSTTPGANNRLEIESIVSYDCEAGRQSSLLQEAVPDPDSDPDPAAVEAAREHRRGLTCCVLVPWEEVSTSVLNLPPSKMDIFIPG